MAWIGHFRFSIDTAEATSGCCSIDTAEAMPILRRCGTEEIVQNFQLA